VYVSLDNHKYGDYKPLIVKSTDRGRSWKSISGDLPDNHLVWRLAQDHVKPELLFAATEFGLFFSIDGGDKWTELEGGVPTISFRDLAIQRRENDLVGASFGRGFFIFDDYSVLREVSEASLEKEGSLYSTRKALWYIPRSHLNFDTQKGSQGDSYYVAPNPDFGATFTYHLNQDLLTDAEARQEAERPLVEAGEDIGFPGWDVVGAEAVQAEPRVFVLVKDAAGNVVRRVEGPTEKGFHRIAWDLRYPAPQAIGLSDSYDDDGPTAMMAAPGKYTASLYKRVDGQTTRLDGEIEFEVERLYEGALPGASEADVVAFWRSYEDAVREASAINMQLSNAVSRVKAMAHALSRSRADAGSLDRELHTLRDEIHALNAEVNGNPARVEVGEKTHTTIGQRLFAVERGISHSLYGPTETSRKSLELARKAMSAVKPRLQKALESLDKLGSELIAAGAPYVEGSAD